jgi:hypothetical protein
MNDARPLESAESASPMITRLVAGVLTGKHERPFEFATWERWGMQLLNLFPPDVARWVVRWQFRLSSLPPDRVHALDVEELAAQRLQDYQDLEGRYPVMVIGSALAGAAAHIAAILGGPFLPQPFILGLRGGSPSEELAPHLALTSSVARGILGCNPNIKAIAHFDPIHDGWLTRTVSHLRLKLIDLPVAYRHFILKYLEPGGTVLYLDCSARWLQFPLTDRFSYQVGGWGGIPSEEFISGSERIDHFLNATGSSHQGGWRVPGVEPVWSAESEWGSEPGLDKALQEFAAGNGYRFQRIRFAHPHDFSRLALDAHRYLFNKSGRTICGLLVETFTQYDPYLVLAAGLLPLWLVFNTVDSKEFLQEILTEISSELPIYYSGLATLSRTPDMVSWEGWAETFKDRNWVNIGAGPRRYPEDMVALYQWQDQLMEHLSEGLSSSLPHLDLSDFLKLLH